MVDMIGSLIILPLRNKNTENLVETLAIFFKEWLKIEKWIGSSHMKIFVFKNIIDKIRSDVLCRNNTPTSSFSRRETRFPSGNLTKFSKNYLQNNE